MSESGAVMDAIATIAETSISGLITERGIGLSSKLRPEQIPHLYLHDPEEAVEELEFSQEEVTLAIELTFVFRDLTQEAVLVHLDAFRDNIRADKKLGGLVDRGWLSSRAIFEHPESSDIIAELIHASRTVGQ